MGSWLGQEGRKEEDEGPSSGEAQEELPGLFLGKIIIETTVGDHWDEMKAHLQQSSLLQPPFSPS